MPTFNNKENKVKNNFQTISISLASPEDITKRSCGEVLKPETVNYRTYKPERDGLFCEKIFGPTKDYECYSGKYKRIRYRGIVCDRCNVEVTEKKVRRERMGHISLTVPVAHIWYFKSAPNKISALLGLPAKKLESVIYYEKYIVVRPGASNLAKMELLSEDEYLDAAAVADDAAVADSLIFAAVAFVVLGRTEDLLAEKTVPFRLVGPVVDRFRLEDLAATPVDNIFRRCKGDADSLEIALYLVFLVIESRHISL